jgi:hypothetical protein
MKVVDVVAHTVEVGDIDLSTCTALTSPRRCVKQFFDIIVVLLDECWILSGESEAVVARKI